MSYIRPALYDTGNCVFVQVTLYRRLMIGRDGYLDQSEI